jgi:hypothetical protein
VKNSFSGVDGQGTAGIFPIGSSTLTYTFNNGTVNIASSDPSYYPFVSETYNTTTGQVVTSTPPTLTDPGADSFVNYYPSDWAQRLARTLGTMSVGDTASLPVLVEARGKLPNLLASVIGGAPDNGNILQLHTTVTATRLANGTVNGIANACQFSYTMYRNFMAPLGQITAPGDPVITVTDHALEVAAANDIVMTGPSLSLITEDEKIQVEVYVPAMEGTFATSNTVPYLPITQYVKHIYGVSSMANPTYNLTVASGVAKALAPAAPPAQQTFTYVP